MKLYLFLSTLNQVKPIKSDLENPDNFFKALLGVIVNIKTRCSSVGLIRIKFNNRTTDEVILTPPCIRKSENLKLIPLERYL